MPSTDTRAALVERIRTAMIAERKRQMGFGCEPGDEDFAHAIADALARSAPEERGEGEVADLLLDYLSDWASSFERGLLIVNVGEEEGPFPRTIRGGPGVGDALCVGPNENAREALLDAALHDGSNDFKRALQAALASPPAPVEGSEKDHQAGIEEAALALMQMRGGPCVPRREEAEVAVSAYLRVVGRPAPVEGERERIAEELYVMSDEWSDEDVAREHWRTPEGRPLPAKRLYYLRRADRILAALASHPVQGAGGVRSFGAALREARVAAGLSLRDAASRLGVTVTHLGAVERGLPAPSHTDLMISPESIDKALADTRRAMEQGAGGGEREERRRSTAFYLWNLAQGSRNIAHYLPDALAHLHTFEQMAVLPLLSEERDLLVRVACGIADNAPWRQSPDMDILKSVVQEYRAASPAPSAPEDEM